MSCPVPAAATGVQKLIRRRADIPMDGRKFRQPFFGLRQGLIVRHGHGRPERFHECVAALAMRSAGSHIIFHQRFTLPPVPMMTEVRSVFSSPRICRVVTTSWPSMRRIKNWRLSRSCSAILSLATGPPRREPDNLTEEMVEPNDALLFKSDLRSLFDGLNQIDRRLGWKRRRAFRAPRPASFNRFGHILP